MGLQSVRHRPAILGHLVALFLLLLPSNVGAVDLKDAAYAFHLSPVQDLNATPSDECFYDVTIPDLIEIGFVQYAWVPWSRLSNESLAIAPHGAFVYKTVNDTLQYEKITLVAADSEEADLIFGPAEEFYVPGANTFEDITSGRVTVEDADMLERIVTGLSCWASPMSYTTTEPFASYQQFAWVSHNPNMCGEYVYEKKGGGLVRHSCDEGDPAVEDDGANATEPEPADDTDDSGGNSWSISVVTGVVMALQAIL